MFTGIVQGKYAILEIQDLKSRKEGGFQYSITLPASLVKGLKRGASVSIDGVCQTVVSIRGRKVSFDAISETLERTTFSKRFKKGVLVNVERAARVGSEIGGHLLSGHIVTQVQIQAIQSPAAFKIRIDPPWNKYLFEKGFVALDGVSLTLGKVENGHFWVHLIPETLKVTTLGSKKVGDWLNLEVDASTQAVVDTVERVLPHMLGPNSN